MRFIAFLAIASALQTAALQVIPDCRACEGAFVEVVRLGDTDGPGAIGRAAWVTRMSDGRWAVTDYQDPRIKIYARDGSYSGHFGRGGQGPGEFVLPAQVWTDPAGDLNVLDLDLLRRTVLSSTGEIRRMVRLDAGFTTVAAFDDGRLVTGALLPTPDQGFGLVHVVNADGQRVGSIGSRMSLEAARASSTFRTLAPSGDSAVWVGMPDRYELQLYSLDGTHLRTVRRETETFRPHDGRIATVPEDGPPRPRIVDIQEQRNGELWVLLRVADTRWREAFVDGLDPYGRPRQAVGDPARYYDGVLEVLDVPSGAVRMRARTDQALAWFAGPGRVAGEAHDLMGVPEVVVLQPAGGG